jgi:hypothetical protein
MQVNFWPFSEKEAKEEVAKNGVYFSVILFLTFFTITFFKLCITIFLLRPIWKFMKGLAAVNWVTWLQTVPLFAKV